MQRLVTTTLPRRMKTILALMPMRATIVMATASQMRTAMAFVMSLKWMGVLSKTLATMTLQRLKKMAHVITVLAPLQEWF